MIDVLPPCQETPPFPGPGARALLPSGPVRLGLDGLVGAGTLLRDGCCPIDLCQIDLDALICNFVATLPKGPLWDRAKWEIIGQIKSGAYDPKKTCPSIVAHAVYSAKVLHMLLMEALWPSIRESNPYTAFDTIDDWLARMGWQDCFDCACRSPYIGDLSPIEYIGEGPIPPPADCVGTMTMGSPDGDCPPAPILVGPKRICCPIEASVDLLCAVKHATVIALARMQRGPRRTLDGINFVISSLGTELIPVSATQEVLPCWPDADMTRTMGNCLPTKRVVTFRICPTKDTIAQCLKDRCQCIQDPCQPKIAHPSEIPAYYDAACPPPATIGAPPRRVYLGVMAAECIVRSMLPQGDRVIIERC